MAAIEADLLTALSKVIAVFEGLGLRYALIGGLARAAWGRARATRDIDVALAIDAIALRNLQKHLQASGFAVVTMVGGDSEDERPDIFVARSEGGVPVDVLIAKTPFEQEAVANSVKLRLMGQTVRVVTAEDLVFYKLLAGRPRDRDDVLDVVRTRLASPEGFDWKRVEKLAADWDIESALADVRRETKK